MSSQGGAPVYGPNLTRCVGRWWNRVEPSARSRSRSSSPRRRIYADTGDFLACHLYFPNSWTGPDDLSARLRLANDGKTLYVADIGASKTYRYPVQPDGSLTATFGVIFE